MRDIEEQIVVTFYGLRSVKLGLKFVIFRICVRRATSVKKKTFYSTFHFKHTRILTIAPKSNKFIYTELLFDYRNWDATINIYQADKREISTKYISEYINLQSHLKWFYLIVD